MESVSINALQRHEALKQASDEVAVDIIGVSKRFGTFIALNKVTLDVRDNEFFTLLGPSGCGKTTLLRTIAGFEDISEGEMRLYGEDIANLPPNERPVNTVFQNYALFPHMNITDNVMFGLLRLGQSETAARKRTSEVLEMVQLSDFSARLPAQLSGGEQQRVALARALAPNPKVLLLDEPLSALDLKLRQSVRLELQQLQIETGITFVFVTHDQEEALVMSDRIAVMHKGEIKQVGSPKEIYEAPNNRFVADFIGDTNFLSVQVAQISHDMATCILPNGLEFTCPTAEASDTRRGHISVRPERISICDAPDGLLQGRITRHIYLGTDLHLEVTLETGEVIATRIQNTLARRVPEVGEAVGISFEAGAARLLAD